MTHTKDNKRFFSNPLEFIHHVMVIAYENEYSPVFFTRISYNSLYVIMEKKKD